MEPNTQGENPDADSPSVTQPTVLSATANQSKHALTFFRKLNRVRAKRNQYIHSHNRLSDNITEANKYVEQAGGFGVTDADAKVLFTLAGKTLSGFRLKQPKV